MLNLIPLLFTLVGNGLTGHGVYTQEVVGYHKGKSHVLAVHSIRQKDRNNNSLFLAPDAASSFREMMVHAAKDGFHLDVLSAFRTHRQQAILKKKRGHLAAPPGWSNHQQGLSVDIGRTTRIIKGVRYRTILYWWLHRNAKTYGFYSDVIDEPWHWTFRRAKKEVEWYG